ncbi:MAG: HAD family hydrolase [Lachnospiraceae bacterium]|nr:HAD family hydrolase [Lachnospiraceae bacterium]
MGLFRKEKPLKEYTNYVFDLYGTLIDMSTDEHSSKLWKLMASFYNVYGCDWSPKKLKKTFWKLDASERKKLSKEKGFTYPEIKLERVFARLLLECEESHPTDIKINDYEIDLLRKGYASNKNETIDMVSSSDWAVAVSNLFRVASTNYMRPYPNTIIALRTLKERGKNVYLLSNAQKIFTMPEIEQSGIERFFDRMYISSDYEMMKPQKEFLELLIEQEGLDPASTVMVGNEILSDVKIALNCGIDSILLNNYHESERDLKRKIRELMKNEKAPKSLYPHIIHSGDIGEIV